MADSNEEVGEEKVFFTVGGLPIEERVVRWLMYFAFVLVILRITGLVIKLFYPMISPPFMHRFAKKYNRQMGHVKALLFSDLAQIKAKNGGKLTILEIGAGSGANFEFYPKGTKVIAIDPNKNYQSYLESNVKNSQAKLEAFIVGRGENLCDVNDNCVPVVVSTLVMCVANDPEAYVREIKRVLKPGGKFYYMEHVSASKNSWTHLLQRLMNPFCSFLSGEKCVLTRKTWQYIDEAGFSRLEYSRFSAPLSRHSQCRNHT
uniref:Methyltransferase-like protein 7A-like n=1 Tax=Saccoglossus kowalevskii TaxID=10224 RepID=A0ABM0MJZ7_SACKO|nr:PREDICTED: methyltransferase-like protein 7A-like [Saccoglossus kowalevskii]